MPTQTHRPNEIPNERDVATLARVILRNLHIHQLRLAVERRYQQKCKTAAGGNNKHAEKTRTETNGV